MGYTKKCKTDNEAAPESGLCGTANCGLKPGDEIEGYRVLRVEELCELESVLYELEHVKTGARHIHIENEDKENTFGVAFRTVPSDSTGVAHVLEHTVLCGSKRYQVRDPFFSMLKRGLSTFMNAFTASDWTMYPFSTQNIKDYYNLMDVYLDAAFYPNLDELSFKQEGHRLELLVPEDQAAKNNPSQALIYKGVVYNEMKGAMSSPSQIMGRALLSALYPDTTYNYNSGGEPSDIPCLTHENLKAFHARFYHPSNAFFYTYGALPLKDHLSFISDRVLKRFSRIDPDSIIEAQPRWTEPRKVSASYPLSVDEDSTKQYQACVAWLTTDIKDSFGVLALSVLEQVLLGNAASPLRKALIDSGIGSALCDATGFDADMRDTSFACGLKEISLDSVDQVEKLIFSTLEKIASQGIEPNLIQSAIHQIEFHRKERTNTPHPYGIKLLLTFAGTWIHQGDPVDCINFDQELDRLKAEIAQGPFLEQLLRTSLLENPHRVLFTLAPDQEMEAKEEKRICQKLAEHFKTLGVKELEGIQRDAKMLEELQETEEDLSVLPTLELEDVPPSIEIIQPDTTEGVFSAVCYEKPTSGILYFTCPAGLGIMKGELLSLVPFFCRVFTGAGTAKRDYAAMAERMDLYTGGVAMTPYAGTGFSDGEACLPFLALQGKSLDSNIDYLFDIIQEFVSNFSFQDHQRIKSLLLQYKAGMESAIVSNGHRYAISLASRNFTQASCIGEMWHGIHQFKFIRELCLELESPDSEKACLERLSSNLETIARTVFQQGNLRPALVGAKESLVRSDRMIAGMLEKLSVQNGEAFKPLDVTPDTILPHEGWITSTSVSFVAQSFKTVRMGHPDAPSLAVISKMLRSLYLHREIREKGGAYGGFSLYSPEEGIFSFGSYRDPYIRRTLEVYDKACDYIIEGAYTDTDIKEAVLQVCADIDKPETPGPAAIKAYYRDILHLSDDKRQQFKKGLLELDKGKVQAVAEIYFKLKETEKGTAVIAGKEKLEEANKAPGAQGRLLTLSRV